MSRPDSIRSKGLEQHVDKHCIDKRISYRYRDLVNWIENGDQFGETVPVLKLSRLFGTSRNTMDKWLIIYHEEKEHGVSK